MDLVFSKNWPNKDDLMNHLYRTIPRVNQPKPLGIMRFSNKDFMIYDVSGLIETGEYRYENGVPLPFYRPS